MKAKLYSNFVKSGTLTGGKMEEAQETDSGFVEDKVNLNWRLCRFLSMDVIASFLWNAQILSA